MRLAEIPAKAPEQFPGTEWTVAKADGALAWVVRARLAFHASHQIDELLIAQTDMSDALVDHVVQRIGMSLEGFVDERSNAARYWRKTATRYRDMMRTDPRAWLPAPAQP